MKSITKKISSIYKEEGLVALLRRSSNFITDRFFQTVVWNAVPKDRTLRLIARSRVLTALYFLLSGTFYREQRSVLWGIASYSESEETGDEPHFRIIRNVHRIEKGLSMKDRRPVFAESYIEQVVADLRSTWDRDGDKRLEWAVDVLAEYFDTVEMTPPISAAKSNFDEFLAEIAYRPTDQTPFRRDEIDGSGVRPEALEQLSRQRTSTRWFEDKDVPREKLDSAIKVALQSPSACNRQSYEFRLFDDRELIDSVSSLAMGATGYRENIPCLGVIVGKQRAYFDDRDRHVIYIDASLAAMAFQFSLETQGLASCCINWPAIPHRERKIETLLNLDPDECVVMMMAIGYPDPDEKVPYSKKMGVEDARSYNEL
ncbi:nitroreductase family protein [Halorubrum trapanicum]|uniref:nitroreductase family protein n=1 Tax=Halorubrum trapanicum TaxID=29284 RepID=UPI000BBB4BAC|nr:nitroreductase family protein [Halorubrum trapanicum]